MWLRSSQRRLRRFEMSEIKKKLVARQAELKEKLLSLKPLQEELEEVELLLSYYNKPKRHGLEQVGHENGCRCRECDRSQ